jgi:hypothetical protein
VAVPGDEKWAAHEPGIAFAGRRRGFGGHACFSIILAITGRACVRDRRLTAYFSGLWMPA